MRSVFYRLIKVAFSYKGWMLLATIIGFLTIGSGIGLLMTSAYIIAKAALHPSIAELQIGIVGVRFFGIFRGVFRYLERYISHEVTFKLLAKFRIWFYRALEPLAPAKLSLHKSADLLTRLVSDVENLKHLYSRVLAPPLVALLISNLMFFLLGIFDFVFSFILLFSFFIAGVGVPICVHFLQKRSGDKIVQLRSQLQVLTVDAIQGMPELLIFGQAGEHLIKYERLNERLIKQQRKSNLIQGFHESLIGLIMNLTVVFMFIIAIPNVSNSGLNGVYLSVLILGIMAAFEAILPLPLSAQYLNQSIKSGKRVFEIIDTTPAALDRSKVSALPTHYSISFKNVSFMYNNAQNYPLKNISFSIEEGEKIAIVGTSGSGKSTIIHLLLKFWENQEGNIFVGGKNIRDIDPTDLRNCFGVVSQNSYLFNETIHDNLLLGNRSATKQEIDRIIEHVHLKNFINNLPHKYQSRVGEHGGQISGGEKQRIVIARALLKGAPILILDEPTVHLDLLSEQKILDNLWKIVQGKTILLITHRLVSLEHVDKILVMRNGRIVEHGTHFELTSSDSFYKKMWELQNQIDIIEKINN